MFKNNKIFAMNHNLSCSNLFSSLPKAKDDLVTGNEDMNMERIIIKKETKLKGINDLKMII